MKTYCQDFAEKLATCEKFNITTCIFGENNIL